MRLRITLVAALTAAGSLALAGVAGADLGLKFGKGFRATLAAENGSPATSTGTALVRLDAAEGFVCFKLTVRGVPDAPVAAHIHRGGPSDNGPVVVGFVAPQATSTAGVYQSKGCVAADPTLIREIQGNPAAFYVNVHTKLFPGGVVRGQLARIKEKAAPKPTCKPKKRARR